MRYPAEENKSDSINISDSQLLGCSDSASSSATASGTSQDGEVGGVTDIATISEHVLFGNNNGQNSFLYMYYSRSNANESANNRRPFTTEGNSSKVGGLGSKVMGSQWNDLTGGIRRVEGSKGSAGPRLSPSAIFYNNNDRDDEEKFEWDSERKSLKPINSIHNDKTPYPVYISPVEELPSISPSPTEMKLRSDIKDEVNITPRNRLDSFTDGLLDDDEWDKICSAPDGNSRYVYSPVVGEREQSRRDSVERLTSTNVNSNLAVSSTGSALSRSANRDQSRSSKRVRVSQDEERFEGGAGNVRKKWSSTSSNSSAKKLSPISSTLSSAKSNPHGVTHHHHRPHTGRSSSSDNVNQLKRVSATTTGDGTDQTSFRNGIGAFFGTEASRKISRSHETTPEEMYEQEMQGWKPRLATAAMIFTATLFILSCSSMLLVFPILVDPILVGLEAKFSTEPVTCRTTNFRNGSGSAECATPSCREGCTLDLFSCIFVDVEYTVPESRIANTEKNSYLQLGSNNTTYANSSFFPFQIDRKLSKQSSVLINRTGILLININGCGYPPEVTCSDFQRKYGSIHSEFPCHFSQQNGSIVVPHYSRRTEIIHLTLAVCVPVGTAVFSGVALCMLVRYHAHLKVSIYRQYAERRKALKRKRLGLDENEVEDEEVTSISELEPQEDEQLFKEENSCDKNQLMLNGASKTGIESRGNLASTLM